MDTNRLNELYDLAKSNGLVKSKREFAERIGAGYTTLVRTMNGEKYYSPDRFILGAENMLRANGIDPHTDAVTLASVMKELKETKELVKRLLILTEKDTYRTRKNE